MQRIQKFLAHQGVASRRQIDQMLQAGRITVNGKPAQPGDQVAGDEKIAVDGKLLRISRSAARPKLMMYHKPIGEVCSRNDPEGRPDIYRNLPGLQHGRWIGIGRLDINTNGLLLFTDQGELANRLMHPSFQVEREYAVRVHGEVTREMLQNLRTGVMLEDGEAHFDSIVDAGGQGTNHWYHVVLKEGRNREVRRLWEAVGAEVSRLTRVRYDTFTLPKWLKPGKFRLFEDDLIKRLYRRLELDYPETASRRHAARGKR